jgi:dTDP-4-dehydrorhamnose reductase
MPNAVVNLAAYTDVDGCETDRALAWRMNVTLVEHLARACRSVDAHLVHISTDYVFDGTRGPYAETDTVGPISYYGKSKLAGENALASSGIDWTVIRTNVVYGTLSDRPDFLSWVLQQFDAGKPVKAVTDQYSNPTFCDDLCETILEAIQRRRTGLYHTGGTDYLSRYEFVSTVATIFHVAHELVIPVTTADLNQVARRPMRGGLITLKATADLGVRMTSVEHGVVAFRHRLLQKTKPPQGLMRGLHGT